MRRRVPGRRLSTRRRPVLALPSLVLPSLVLPSLALLSLLGLRASGPVTITGAHHIRKSYPEFFAHLQALGARVDVLARS